MIALTSNYQLKPMIMTRLCVLIFACAVTLFTAGNLNASAWTSWNTDYVLAAGDDQQQFTVS